jgi:hypothetical protein
MPRRGLGWQFPANPLVASLARNASRNWNCVPILIEGKVLGLRDIKEFHFHV